MSEKQTVEDQTRKGFWFAQVPIDVIRNAELSAGAVRLYANIAVYTNDEKKAWPGQERLAAEIGVCVRTVYNYLQQLLAAGCIKIIRRGRRRTNVYHLPDLPDRSNKTPQRKSTRRQREKRTPAPCVILDDVSEETTPAKSFDRLPHADPIIHQRACDLFDDTEVAFSLADAWHGALNQLRLQMDKSAFKWLRDIQLVGLEGDILIAHAASSYAAELLQGRLLPSLTRSLEEIVGRPIGLRVAEAHAAAA